MENGLENKLLKRIYILLHNCIEWLIDRFVNDFSLNVCLWQDLYPCRPHDIGNYYMCILLLNIKSLYLVTIWNRKLNFDTMYIDWIPKNRLQQTSISLQVRCVWWLNTYTWQRPYTTCNHINLQYRVVVHCTLYSTIQVRSLCKWLVTIYKQSKLWLFRKPL